MLDQRLVNTGLIRPQCPAALEQQRDALKSRRAWLLDFPRGSRRYNLTHVPAPAR
jgi:hypothetical protein